MKRALVLTLALVLGLGIAAFAGPLSGEWSSTLTADISTGTIASIGLSSSLTVDYTVGGWTFSSLTGFTEAGWDTQEFTASGTLGAFTVSSDLIFNPQTPAFTTWYNTGSVSIAGVTLTGQFRLNGDNPFDANGYPVGAADGSGWAFGATGQAGALTVGATAYFNSYVDSTYGTFSVQTSAYCFCFTSIDFTASFPFACIDEVDIDLSFNATNGFGGVDFSVSGITVPSISWLTFDADLSFDTTSKTLTITPTLNLGSSDCITLYADLLVNGEVPSSGIDVTTNPLDITGLEFEGLSLSHTWNGVTFTDYTAFGGYSVYDLNSSYSSDYWELFQITTSGDSCCGGAIDFTINTYFDSGNNGTSLFGWGETDASLDFGIGSNFTISTGLNIGTGGLNEISFGFDATW